MPNRRQALKWMTQAALVAGSTPFLAPFATARKHASDSPVDFASLSGRLDGRLLLPSSERYESARRTFSFNPRTDRRPAAIAGCENEVDVAKAIEFARSHELEIAVRSGGHDVLAASTCDGGLLIDLGEIAEVRLDGDRTIAVTGPGARSGNLDQVMAKEGHLLALGCNPQVGAAGLILGGGLGWFLGRHGAACDNLQWARVVTADGRIVTASEDSHPDLLWALRGGGGNFGVVVEMGLTAHPLDTITGGYICFDGERLPEFLHFYSGYMANAPDGLVVELTVMEPSRRVIFVIACFLGDTSEAERAFAPLRAFDEPLADGLRTAPYPEVMSPTNEVGQLFRPDPDAPKEANDAPGIQWLGGSLEALGDAAIDAIVAQCDKARGGWALNMGHHMHGAVCRVASSESALPRPCGTFTYNYAGWWGSADSAKERMAWVDGAVAAMRAHETAAYINYLSHDDPAAVRQAYGENWTRLQGIKRRYDPDNVFRGNRNIAVKGIG